MPTPESNHIVGARKPLNNCRSHIDASHSRQPLVKGERLVRYEVNAVMPQEVRTADKRLRLFFALTLGAHVSASAGNICRRIHLKKP